MTKGVQRKVIKPKTHVEVQIDPYPLWVTVISGSSEFKRQVKLEEVPEVWGEAVFGEDANCRAYVILYENHPHILLGDDADFYSLVHECIHTVVYLYKTMGIPITYDNDEVLAYHTEHLVKSLQSQLQLPM